MISESDRFNTNQPDLCSALRWKGQFILSEPDPTVPRSNDGLFWCLYTQPASARTANWLNPVSAIPRAARATEPANVGRSCCRKTCHFERREICFLATRNCRGFRIGQKHVGAGALTRPAERSSANWYLCKTRRAAPGRSVRAYVSIKT